MPYPLAAIRGHSVVASGVVAPNTYSISGLVLDSDGITGVSGSTIALGAYSAISGVTGAYVISGIPAGTSGSLTCTKTGYLWYSITIAAMGANLTSQNFTSAIWFDDDFSATEAAPIATPHTCDVKGTLVVSQPNNAISIASGQLKFDMPSSGSSTQSVITSAGITYAAGRVLKIKIDTATGNAGTMLHSVNNNFTKTFAISLNGFVEEGSAAYNTLLTGTGTYYLIRAQSGQCYYVKDSTLGFIGKATSTAALYIGMSTAANNAKTYADQIRVVDLPAPWTTTFGIATASSASPSTGATLAHEANCLVEVTWTAATGETLELIVRQSDATHNWITRCSQGGSTIKLIENNAGETERASTAQTFTNGVSYRIVVLATANAIYNWVDGSGKNSYTSASFNNTATQAQVNATAGALANFVTWPRTLSGTALSTLQAV